MVLRELERFLTVVGHELDTHDDLVDAIRAAAEQTLLIAQVNPLLNRMLASAHSVSAGGSGAEAELLPFLTTDAEPLIVAAKEVIAARHRPVPGPGDDAGRAGRGHRRHRPAGAQPRDAAGRRPGRRPPTTWPGSWPASSAATDRTD